MNRIGVIGIHGPMPINFSESGAEESLTRLKHILFNGYLKPIHFESDRNNIPGHASGQLLGGNLSMLVNCMGTPDDFSPEGCILFLEDVDEYRYRIDRMLVQLKRSGKLEKLSALIIGKFTKIHDNDRPFGKDVRDMVLDLAGDYGYPVCFDAPIGHELPNYPLPVGQNIKLEIDNKTVVLIQSEN
jgi:muramoyltetrapeptide carboxypeptidase